MICDLRVQFVKLDHRQDLCDQGTSSRITERKLCLNLLLNSFNESSVTLKIKRHGDDSPKKTSKKARNPLRTVLSPEQSAITFPDPSRFQFPGKPPCSLRNLTIRP